MPPPEVNAMTVAPQALPADRRIDFVSIGTPNHLHFPIGDLEAYGLAEFARRCREKVIWSAGELIRGSKRLGQWMDWGNDYYTFSDTNIEYIWRFLKLMHERGWLYKGRRSTEWCPRCGTSISRHELLQGDVYRDRTDPSVFVRFPLLDRPGESVVVWTTTPWTLPANVAAAVHPEAEYILSEGNEWVARERFPDSRAVRVARGEELLGLLVAAIRRAESAATTPRCSRRSSLSSGISPRYRISAGSCMSQIGSSAGK